MDGLRFRWAGQSCRLGDERANVNAASNRNGVVGNSGINISATPRPRAIKSLSSAKSVASLLHNATGGPWIAIGQAITTVELW